MLEKRKLPNPGASEFLSVVDLSTSCKSLIPYLFKNSPIWHSEELECYIVRTFGS
jgi:hypothetical protein